MNWQKQLATTTVQPPNPFAPNRFEYIYTQLFVAATKAANIPAHFCTHSHSHSHSHINIHTLLHTHTHTPLPKHDAHTCNIYVCIKYIRHITPSFKSASIWLVATYFTHASLFGCFPMNEQCHIFHHTNLYPLLFVVGVAAAIVVDACVCLRTYMLYIYIRLWVCWRSRFTKRLVAFNMCG